MSPQCFKFSLRTPVMACVREYIEKFPASVDAIRGYLTARDFLRAFSDNSLTFTSYRTHVERLLLWALIIKQKPFDQLKRQDAEDYLEFCRVSAGLRHRWPAELAPGHG